MKQRRRKNFRTLKKSSPPGRLAPTALGDWEEFFQGSKLAEMKAAEGDAGAVQAGEED